MKKLLTLSFLLWITANTDSFAQVGTGKVSVQEITFMLPTTPGKHSVPHKHLGIIKYEVVKSNAVSFKINDIKANDIPLLPLTVVPAGFPKPNCTASQLLYFSSADKNVMLSICKPRPGETSATSSGGLRTITSAQTDW